MYAKFENVDCCSGGVWEVRIEPHRLMRFGSPLSQKGSVSILLVDSTKYDDTDHTLEFGLDSAVLMNLGRTSTTILVDAGKGEPKTTLQEAAPTMRRSAGDSLFLENLKSLPEDKAQLGVEILKAVRGQNAGELVYKEPSKKFVESPDNYWVVRIQPRVKNLRIIVYGSPTTHKDYDQITLKPDMAGYSNFVVEAMDQLGEAIDAILNAKRMKDAR